jgi:thiol-disulfide isomerase/thioredoxin
MRASDPAEVSLASGRPQLDDFFAYWCKICQRAAPAVYKAEQIYGDRVGFVFLDTDDPATYDFKRDLG